MTSNHRKQRVKKTYKKDMQKRDLLKQVLKLGVMPIVLLMFFSCADDNTFNNQDPEAPQIGGTPFDIFADMDYTQMIYIKGGTFEMGATEEQISDAQENESPAHKVTLDGYYISKYEVTQKLWERVMGNNPSSVQGENLPVVNVSWNDCQEFIKKLNELTGKSFSLPTEAEWEYAARGGDKSLKYKYAGSNTIDDVAFYNTSNSNNVGGKQANELGLYDMSGNVAEWCYDGYAAYSEEETSNPTGSTSNYRTVRGGSWSSQATECRVSYRSDSNKASDATDNIGFRLALRKPYYTVSVEASEGGSAKIEGVTNELYIRKGTKVTLTATPNTRYDFINWTLNDKEVSTEMEFTTEIVTDGVYKANFGTCFITVSKSEGASKVSVGTSPNVQNASKGTEVNLAQRGNPDTGYKFGFWLMNGSIFTQSLEKAPKSIKINNDTEFSAIFTKTEKENGFEVVDLGLSVKWATCNIGASKQEEAGSFFAWGETETKDKYDLASYKWWSEENGMTKYCTDNQFGVVDGKTSLDDDDDVAIQKCGGNWRMPTYEEWEELKNECEWTQWEMNGVKGYIVLGKNKLNYIFIPLTGFAYGENKIYSSTTDGYYWTKSLKPTNSLDAGYFHFYSNVRLMGYHERYTGQPVRAVVATINTEE